MKDMIYRQDAINLLKKWSDGYKYFEAETELAIKEFKNLPSAQTEQMGHWVFEEYPDGYYHSVCSECEHWFEESAFLKPYNYCPNCGVKMDV